MKSVLNEVVLEMFRADSMYGALINPHHALGVLLEEFDELKAAVMLKDQDGSRMAKVREEALHVAAVAARIMEMCDAMEEEQHGKP